MYKEVGPGSNIVNSYHLQYAQLKKSIAILQNLSSPNFSLNSTTQ